jgi:hypothetical protein
MTHHDIARPILPLSLRMKYNLYQFFDHYFGRKKFFKDRAPFYADLELHLKSHPSGKILDIERVSDISISEFKKKYVKTGVPVVFDGAAKNWPCVKNWSLEYFKQLHGDDNILLVDQTKSGQLYEVLTLSDIIDNINNGGDKYYKFYPLLAKHPEHKNDVDQTWLRSRNQKLKWFENLQLFIGGENTKTLLHNANQGNLFTQVYGQKTWMLYDPAYIPIFDPEPTKNKYRNASEKIIGQPFNPFEPRPSGRYHFYQYLNGYKAEMIPGDVLWVPPYYWHAVKNETKSIGVGYRWFAPFYSFKMSPLYMFLDFFSTNPSIWKRLQLAMRDPNEMHLNEMNQLEKAQNALKEFDKKKNHVDAREEQD